MAEDNLVPTSTEIQHPPMSIGKKLLTIAFTIIVTVSLNFVFSLLSNYIVNDILNQNIDGLGIFLLCSFVIPSALLYSIFYFFWKSHSFLRKCFLYLNLCLIGLGILLYILWPTPLNGCSKESSYFRVAGIFIYRGKPWDWQYSQKLPKAYIWNFRCRPDDAMYDGQTNKYIYISGVGTDESPILQGADASSFYHIPNTDYARDLNHVFFYKTIVPEAHYSTFRPMVTIWGTLKDVAKDDKNVYMGSTITGKNPKTFRYIGGGLAGEGLLVQNGYGFGSEIRDRSEYYYFKDDKNVYFSWQLKTIDGADPQSFTLIRQPRTSGTQQLAQDKNYFYVYSEKISDIDPIRWKYIGGDFFTNRSSVYNYKTKSVVEGADLRTFRCETDEVYGSVKCWDKNYYYYALQKCDVKNCDYKIGKSKIFTLDEVLLHNTPGDCLAEIGGEVYDITKYYTESGYNGPKLCSKDFIIKTYHGLSNPDTRWNLETREKYKIGEILKN